MHLGFDAKRFFLNRTGLGNYSRSLIEALLQSFPAEEYFLYTPRVRWNPQTQFLQDHKNIHIRKPAFPWFTSVWRSRLVIPRLKRDHLDIYHGLSHEVPGGIRKTGIKTVVTIHDLIFMRYPGYYRLADRKIYEAKFRHACRHADQIIAISEQTKRDLITFLQVPEERIEVIYQSCHPAFRQEVLSEQKAMIRQRYHLPERFLFNVGTIEPRKNLMLIARALRLLPSEIKCAVVGKKTRYFDQVNRFLEENGMTGRMIFLENVPFSDLPALYQCADIFLYPSVFEGFGIPVLEAVSGGTPVLAASGSCLEEAGGPGSLYLPPHDINGWAEAIQRTWTSPVLGDEMSRSGITYSRNFLPEIIAGKMNAVYHQLQDNRKGTS